MLFEQISKIYKKETVIFLNAKKLINNFKLNLLENGYVVIKNLFIKSEVKDLLNSFEENIDYCNKTLTKTKYY